jgi:uncharacterized protein (UPF0264 family)
MPWLLVSVRSEAEAEAALSGGAALIDVKEPAHGSLGRASEETLIAVLRSVAGRRPVSAALGELAEASEEFWPLAGTGLAYVKWGLASCQDRKRDWRRDLAAAAKLLDQRLPDCRLVAVAYADWRRARAPHPADVCRFAGEHRVGAFLLDTWEKDGTTLLDWLSLDEVGELRHFSGTAGIPVALAGSLGVSEMVRLLSVRPDWFAVRGAVCEGNRRSARLCPHRVRALVDLLDKPLTAATHAG